MDLCQSAYYLAECLRSTPLVAIKMTTWGASHGPAIGAVLDGVPAGSKLDMALIQARLDRRRPQGAAWAQGVPPKLIS